MGRLGRLVARGKRTVVDVGVRWLVVVVGGVVGCELDGLWTARGSGRRRVFGAACIWSVSKRAGDMRRVIENNTSKHTALHSPTTNLAVGRPLERHADDIAKFAERVLEQHLVDGRGQVRDLQCGAAVTARPTAPAAALPRRRLGVRAALAARLPLVLLVLLLASSTATTATTAVAATAATAAKGLAS